MPIAQFISVAREIRLATPSDFATLIKIEQRSNPYPLSEKQLHNSFASQANQTSVICENSLILGFIIVQVVIDTADIVHIVTDQSQQGKGYAKTLLTEVLSILNAKAVTKVLLEVRESNITAQHLYDKCGFNVIGKRKNYYAEPKEDAILMHLEFA